MAEGPAYGGVRGGVASIAVDEGLRTALSQVVTNAVELLGRRSSVSVTLIERDGPPTTLAASDAQALALDDAQYADGDGPCLLAARSATIVRVDDLDRRTEWRRLHQVSQRQGVRTSLSVPLTLSGRAAGSLNAYSRGRARFAVDDADIIVTLATQASVMSVNAQSYWAAFDGTRRLTVAIQARSTIDVARGILMATHGMSADDAFRHLAAAADGSGRPLAEVARELVARAEAGGGDDGAGR